MAVASGYANVALAAGWERMDEVDTRTGNFYISTAACKDFETRLGESIPLIMLPWLTVLPGLSMSLKPRGQK